LAERRAELPHVGDFVEFAGIFIVAIKDEHDAVAQGTEGLAVRQVFQTECVEEVPEVAGFDGRPAE
jgi:hypothetical protein